MEISDDPYVNLFDSEILRRVARNCMDAVEAVCAERPDVECNVFWSKSDGAPRIVATIYNGDAADGDPSHDGLGVNDEVEIWETPSRVQIEQDLRLAVARIDEAIAGCRRRLLAASDSEAAR